MMDPVVARDLLRGPNSPIHQKILQFHTNRIKASERYWGGRHERYREAERQYRAFRVPDETDRQTAERPLTQGVQKLVIPFGYAVMQSLLAFCMLTIAQRKPLIPVQGIGGKDVRAGLLLEALLDVQAQSMQPSLQLVWYQQIFDAFRYGVGIVKGAWTVREFPTLVRAQQPMTDLFGAVIGIEDALLERDVIAYEGNQLINVSPFDFFPDPRRPLADFQRGEFVYHRMRRSMTELKQLEAQGFLVGVDRIPRHGRGGDETAGQDSDNPRIVDLPSQDSESLAIDAVDYDGDPYVTIHEGVAYCMPQDFGIESTSTTPRRYGVTLANLSQVLRFEPVVEPSHRYNFEVYECSYDWHSPANHGLIEIFSGLQYYYSWLFNSRMAAVRRTLNNEMVVDPSILEEMDLLDPEPGRLLRVKRDHYGEGMVDKAVFPITVQDTTQGHLTGDAAVVQDLIQTVIGVSNLSMGMPNPGRRAATEVQGQLKLAAGRQQLLIEQWVEQSAKWQAFTMVRNIQAFLDLSNPIALPEPYRTALGAPYIQLTPDMLTGNVTFPFTDAGLPSDRTFEASVWKELLTSFLQNPAAATILPPATLPAITSRFLRAMNVRDLQTFGLSPFNFTVEPDAQVEAQAQAGNLVPAGGNGTGIQWGGTTQTGGPAADGFPLPPGNGVPGGGSMGHA